MSADHLVPGICATASLAESLAGEAAKVVSQGKAIEHEYKRATQALARSLKTIHKLNKDLRLDVESINGLIALL